MTKNDLRVGIFQSDIIWEDIDANFSGLTEFMKTMSDLPDLLVLPETFGTGFTNRAKDNCLKMNGSKIDDLRNLARSYEMAICGSFIILDGGDYYNRFLFIHKDGLINTYDKRHLFSMSAEHKNYAKGSSQLTVSFLGWRIRAFICYDLRFPVWCRNQQDYDLAIFVANWPASRDEVWQTLLKARAIENQCYVVGANRVGDDGNGINYVGHSMVVDPKGRVMNFADGQPQLIIEELNLASLRKFRTTFSVLCDADDFTLNISGGRAKND